MHPASPPGTIALAAPRQAREGISGVVLPLPGPRGKRPQEGNGQGANILKMGPLPKRRPNNPA
eukprot:6869204-Lingulodinium_polyedra.AAC.1